MKQIPVFIPGREDKYLPDISQGAGIQITWQVGFIQDSVLNGATVEGVLRACVQRLERLNGLVPSSYNRGAINQINAAIGLLEDRTRDRAKRGVMGTYEV